MTATAIDGANRTSTNARSPGSSTGASLFAELMSLTQQPHTGQGFLTRALGVIGRAFASPYARVYYRRNAEVFKEEYHSGSTSPAFWSAPTEDLLTGSMARGLSRARLLSARNSELQIAILAAPLFDSTGIVCGAVALVVRCGAEEARRHLTLLESLATLASHLQATGHSVERSATPAGTANAGAASQAQTLGRAAACESDTELAFSITNGLRNKFGFEQATLGRVRGSIVEILSISGLDDVKPRSPGVQCIRSAMEECLDLGAPVLIQRDGTTLPEGARPRMHTQWHGASRGASVASLPLRFQDRIVAVLSMRQSSGEALTPEKLSKLQQTVEPFAAALVLLRRAQRGLARHAIDSARSSWDWLWKSGGIGRKLMLTGLVAVTLWFILGTLPYHLTVPCVLQPAEVRHLSTPFDTVLESVSALPGDRVQAGQVLAKFDDQELATQRAQYAAELEVYRQERLRALAVNQPVEARLAEANEALSRTRLSLVEARLKLTEIRAPFDGVIVAGDLRHQIGAALPQGTALFEMAPLERWTVELAVPESAVAFLHPGLAGEFASTGRPENVQPLRLSRIRPAAEIRGQKNVYVAEAALQSGSEWFRPGMEGVARIRAERRPVWWLTLHPVVDYLRLRFWL